MNSELTVRPATLQDAPWVFAMATELATSFNPEHGAFESSYHDLLNNEEAKCLVTEIEQELVGYLLGFDYQTFYANGRVSRVEEVFVKEPYRKQGVGRALMKHFEDWCIERDSKLIALATRRASHFYEALGFEASATYFKKLIPQNRGLVE